MAEKNRPKRAPTGKPTRRKKRRTPMLKRPRAAMNRSAQPQTQAATRTAAEAARSPGLGQVGDTAASAAPQPDSPQPDSPQPDAPQQAAPQSAVEKDARNRPAAATPSPQRRGGALSMIFGGIIAAGIGGGAVYYAIEEGLLPVAGTEADLEPLQAQIAAQNAEIAAFEARLDALAAQDLAVDDDIASVEARIEARLDDRLAEFEAAIAGEMAAVAETRLATERVEDALGGALERIDANDAAVADLQTQMAGIGGIDPAQMDALQDQIAAAEAEQTDLRDALEEVRALAESRLEDIQAEAEQIRADADARATRAEALAALESIDAALRSGAPFAQALDRVTAVADDIPQVLRDNAAGGVASLAELQDRFAAASRPALSAALQGAEADNPIDRVTNFLRSQVGARSLTPREGDDPDAVMSRATQAVNDGDLETTLAELESLPDAGQAAMAGWIDDARARLAAIAAHETLTQTLTGQ